ncbi:hypothetical protein [Streptomyces griseorubiginosus]|uniref:hypothetical protein n=1 Tax=Streptomyces griseorubiginosus TaxID=67304 RepID=UPI000AEC416E|nr:hypothetical protein [Streptomyces griseorubiginosus]
MKSRSFQRRAVASLAVLSGLATLVAGCAASQDAKSTTSASATPKAENPVRAWTCAETTFHWGRLSESTPLVAASQVVRVTSGSHLGLTTYAAIPVRHVTASVESSGKLDAHAVLASLRAKMGRSDLAEAGKTLPIPGKEGLFSTDPGNTKGDFVGYLGVHVVTADFAYGCVSNKTGKSVPAYGTVTTWYRPIQGEFKCGIDMKLNDAAREANSLLCGEKASQGE